MFEVNGYELKTRELFATAFPTGLGHREHSLRLLIARTFFAMSSWSLPIERIEQVGSAITGIQLNDDWRDALKKELSALVRAKVLRSRVERGQRLWEVNY